MKSRALPFRDHDFLATVEGLLFCVVGNVHPPGRAIGYLKYVPSKVGKWGRTERYERVLRDYTMPSVEETVRLLRLRFPQYTFRSTVLGIEMSAVPRSLVREHYRPEEKVRQLHSGTAQLDPLEAKVVALTSLLSETGGIDITHLGVSGSILTAIHNPSFSDMDLTVHGLANAFRMKAAVEQLFEDGLAKPFEGKFLETWSLDKAKRVPLTPREITELYKRKKDRGFYQGTQFSIHPVRLQNEVKERYGDRRFRRLGFATIRARCRDATEAPFLPATYRIEDVTVQEGPQVSELREVTTYDGFYAGAFREGELLVARGKLERVELKLRAEPTQRLVVGSFEARGNDFIKPAAI